MTSKTRGVRFVAAVAIVIIAAPPAQIAAVVASQQTAPQAAPPGGAKPAPASPQPAAPRPAGTTPASAAAPAPIDGGWPRIYDLPSGASILMYQPQIASWANQKHVVAYSAISYRDKGAAKPGLGTIRLEAGTKVSVEDRLVQFDKLKIVEANFQTLSKEQVNAITSTIEKAIPADVPLIALDRVLANLDKSGIIPKNAEGVKADPPTVFYSTAPAVMVNIDGDPIWSPIKENDLKYAVNTNWDLFQHGPTNTLYLRNEGSWLKAADVKGPWTAAGTLPASFSKLPADDNWKEVKAALPGKPIAAAAVPKVFVSLAPAELIYVKGTPVYAPVQGTNLLWVSNTDNDVFRAGKSGLVYYLVAGRWFSAPDFTGPWTFATTSLPEDFKKIPLEHDRSRVLASVPGTDQAAEAVLIAQIPQTARVKKSEIKAPEVDFGGDPQFQPIEKTTVQRAVNTDKDVFKVGDSYYMCHQGVWFVGKSATGPWQAAESVPEAIYQIPASSPSHHVTYVTVEDDDDDEWVTYAAAAGYTGMMVAWGCTVWGSGWYYPPYYGYGGYYPYYYGHFPTYGYSAWYNPYTGGYGRSAAVYGPYGGAGVAQAYNPRTGTYAQTRQGSNVYGSWGSTAVQRGDDWAKTNRYTNNRTGNTTRTIRTDEGGAVTRRGADGGRVAVGNEGNVYAGKDGNVYRNQDGNWQKYDNGNWNNTPNQPGERPTPTGDRATTRQTPTTGERPTTADRTTTDRSTVDQLNRDARARAEGSQRTRDAGTYRSAPSTPRTGSYRGGGARAGGGRRR